jgi:serine/threonine protein kinase
MLSTSTILQAKVWDGEKDCFDHTVIIWKDGQGSTFCTCHSGRMDSYYLDDLPACDPLPISLACAPWCPNFTEVDSSIIGLAMVYLKTPDLLNFDAANKACLQDMYRLQKTEIDVYKSLLRSPHPNICYYYSCMQEEGRVGAIVLCKYLRSLESVLNSDKPWQDKEQIMADVRAVLEHLHLLGYVHNDINPSNVLLDEEDRVVLVDFEITGKMGEAKDPHLGMPFWAQKSITSQLENNWFSLDLL